MKKEFVYFNKEMPIHKVELLINETKKDLVSIKDGEWRCTENISSPYTKFFYIINEFFWIPDDSQQFVLDNDTITSICKENILNNNIIITDLFCCFDIEFNEEQQKYFPVKKTNFINDVREVFYVWCNLSNVRYDFILTLEIYNNNQVFDIITVVIRKSSSDKHYNRSFFCSIPTSYFINTDTWNIKARVTSQNRKIITVKFNKITTQTYTNHVSNIYNHNLQTKKEIKNEKNYN